MYRVQQNDCVNELVSATWKLVEHFVNGLDGLVSSPQLLLHFEAVITNWTLGDFDDQMFPTQRLKNLIKVLTRVTCQLREEGTPARPAPLPEYSSFPRLYESRGTGGRGGAGLTRTAIIEHHCAANTVY